MDHNIKIGIIGRQINNKKWSPLFDILDQGKEEEFWDYTKHSIDNGKTYTGSDDTLLIFLATNPHHTEGKEYINFPYNTDECDIVEKMQAFIDKVLAKDHVVDQAAVDKVENGCQSLLGVIIEINDREVMLSKDDANSLKEMLQIIDHYGFTIKDVIVE